MDVGVLAGLYGGIPARVVERAKEYMRVTVARKSARVDLTTPVACLLVAGKSMEETLDQKRLSSLAGVSHRLVEQSMRKILNAVGVKSIVQTTPAALCIRFGCEAITELVNRVYAEYQVVVERLSRGKGKSRVFDFREPVFAAACLYACSKHASLRVDKVKLLNAVCGNPTSFESIVSSIEVHCKASLSGTVISRRKRVATPVKESAAVLADAVDKEQLMRARQSLFQSPPGKTPHKALRRIYERTQGSGQGIDALGNWRSCPTLTSNDCFLLCDVVTDSLDQESPTRARTPKRKDAMAASASDYAAWRAKALEHMRRQPEEVA